MAKAQQVVETALRELFPAGAPRETLARARASLSALLPDVIEDFAARVAANPDLRPLQRTAALDVTLTNGVADLSDVVEDDGVLLDCLRTAEITLDGHAVRYPVRLRESVSALRAKSMLDSLYIFGHLEGTTLTLKNPDTGNLDDLSGTLKVKASRLPTVAQVHPRLVGFLARMLAEAARPHLAAGGSAG